MTTQDISSLDATWARLAGPAWSAAWRITGLSFVFECLAAWSFSYYLHKAGPLQSPVFLLTAGIRYAVAILVPFLVLSFLINRDFGKTRLEVAHVKYGYLVAEHLRRGLASSVSGAFVWRFVLIGALLSRAIQMLLLLKFVNPSAFAGVSLFVGYAASGQLLSFYTPLQTLAFHLASYLPLEPLGEQKAAYYAAMAGIHILVALPVAWLSAVGTLKMLIGKRTPRFTYVLIPANANEAAETHLSGA